MDKTVELSDAFLEKVDKDVVNDASDSLRIFAEKCDERGVDASKAMVNLSVAFARVCQTHEMPCDVFPLFCTTGWAAAKAIEWKKRGQGQDES